MSKLRIFLILSGICLLVYANSLRGAFVLDDTSFYQNEKTISSLSQTWKSPIGLSYTIAYKIGGFNPLPYHCISLLLHIVAVCSIYVFFTLFFGSTASLFGAILFAVHPVNTEAVSWISGRVYLFHALFTIIPYLIYRKATYGKFNFGLYLLAVLLCACWGSQNIGFYTVFPIFIILMDMYFGKTKNVLLWIPFFLAVGLAFFNFSPDVIESSIKTRTGNSLLGMIIELSENDFHFMWVNSIFSFGTNLKLLLWPMNLTIFHEPYFIFIQQMQEWANSIFCFVLLFSLLACGHGLIKRMYLIFALFILWLLPTFSPIPIASLVAERYLYGASIAFCMFLALIFDHWKKYSKKTVICIFAVLFVFYSARTIIRNTDYKTPLIFWARTVEASPYSYRAHNNLGAELVKLNNLKQAEIAFKYSLLSKTDHKTAIENLKKIAKAQGKKIKAIKFKDHPELNMDFTKE